LAKLISLIVCTIGRSEPLARLLRSLKSQTDGAFEIVVVDQNPDNRIEQALKSFSAGQRIRRVRSEPGLARARNVGLRYAEGDVAGFPDDDCWYPSGVIAHVRRYFDQPQRALLTGRTVDRDGIESVSSHRAESGFVDRRNVFESGNSNTVFVRSAVACDVGGFDETLGIGAATLFQSGEETDFLLRCLGKGYQPYYDRYFVVHHDQIALSAEQEARRALTYSSGYGRVLRLHRYGIGHLAPRVGRAAARGAVCALRGDLAGARLRYGWAIGAVRGFFAPT
jgi:glycosyltransferase involved in cell wall biosynthesis